MKIFIPLIFLSVTLFSCEKKCSSTTGLLTQDELSWISYSGGEVLIFKSQQNVIDTIHIGNKIISSSAGTSEDHPCTHPFQSVAVNISDFLDIVNLRLYNSHNDQWNSGAPSIEDSYGEHGFLFLNFTPQNNISINGNIYNSVYVMNIDTSTFTSPTIWKIYYTKANGILRYDFTKNGGVWEKN